MLVINVKINGIELHQFLIAYCCTSASHFCHMPSWTVSASFEVFTRGGLTHRRVWGGGWAHLPTWLGSCLCRSAGGGLLEGGGGGGGGEREEEGEWSWPAADLAAALPQVANPLLSLALTPSKWSVGKLRVRCRAGGYTEDLRNVNLSHAWKLASVLNKTSGGQFSSLFLIHSKCSVGKLVPMLSQGSCQVQDATDRLNKRFSTQPRNSWDTQGFLFAISTIVTVNFAFYDLDK